MRRDRNGGQSDDDIRIVGARENNLKNLTLRIPKHLITVFTGVSGSGKSSLVFDTIAAESQRQLNETFSSFIRHRLPHYGQPDADALENLSPAIVVDQQRLGGTARSTVGTVTDIHALLRLLFSRVGQPFVGHSHVFSFNHPEGMCQRCEGLGTVSTVDVDALLDRSKSLNEGAIRFPSMAVGTARWKRYVLSGYFDNDKPLADYSPDEWDTLLHAEAVKPPHPLKGWWASSKYEGLMPRFARSYLAKEPDDDIKGVTKAEFERVVMRGPCLDCGGARLNPKVLGCRIGGLNIAEFSAMQVGDLLPRIEALNTPAAVTMVAAITGRLKHLASIGLGYLSLDRQTGTLSGGESQRVKLVRHLGSSLTGMCYIFDEPSIGLHARDVHQLNELLRQLRDRGNTILVVEHDPDVIAIADHVIDMGPHAGRDGGQVVYAGDLAGLYRADTLTGRFMSRPPRLNVSPRKPSGWLPLQHARLHNLCDVSVKIPQGVLTVVTGVAGSGKSSLINGVFSHRYPEAVCIDQGALHGSRRSNAATYTGLLDGIRRLFSGGNEAASASLFSSNSAGACPACKGLGVTSLDLAFMDPIVTECEVCHGRRFTAEALRYTFRGKNIAEVLALTMDEAIGYFIEPELRTIAQRVSDVGLGYMSLGQPLSTLSGGERQRIKLAAELAKKGNVYVLDEPTTGLHLCDIERLLGLMDRLVEMGSTLIVIEHNLDVIARADWIIDMGPGAGHDGGRVMFEGTPADLANDEASVTGRYFSRHLMRGSTAVAGFIGPI